MESVEYPQEGIRNVLETLKIVRNPEKKIEERLLSDEQIDELLEITYLNSEETILNDTAMGADMFDQVLPLLLQISVKDSEITFESIVNFLKSAPDSDYVSFENPMMN